MKRPKNCPDCQGVDRRDFVKLSGAAIAGAAATSLFDARFAHAAGPSPKSAAETVVGELYASLTDDQRKAICRPFNHKDRTKISPNWHVTKTTIEKDFSASQQKMIDQIVRNITTEDGYERFQTQMDEDDTGMGSYSIAIFGKPGEGKFQWMLTGRHTTMRADGDSVDKAAFGGPIVYGHGEENVKQNLFYYQTQKANEVFQSLDAKQAAAALLKKAPKETDVLLQGKQGKFPGISIAELADDQKELFESTLKVLAAPYRKEDVDEAIQLVKKGGGLDSLHMAFYQEEDLEDDKVWDIWRVEGPTMVWHFRGAPHVHAYINIGMKG